MRILVADETNNEPSENILFFLYGGIVFDSAAVSGIGSAIQTIRNEFQISPSEQIKFNHRSCPKHLTKEQHSEIKNRILDLAIKHNCRLIVNCVLHDIAKNKSSSELMEMASSCVFKKFDEYCEEERSPGLVLAHRWPHRSGYNFLESILNDGINYESGRKATLKNIHGFAQVSDNSTPLMSIADIALGSFRYCINDRNKTKVNEILMPKLSKLMWYRMEEGERYTRGKGLNFSPRHIRHAPYREQYVQLAMHINEYANLGVE